MSPNLDSVIYQNQYSLSYNTLANSSKYHFYYFVPLLSHAFLLSLPTLHSFQPPPLLLHALECPTLTPMPRRQTIIIRPVIHTQLCPGLYIIHRLHHHDPRLPHPLQAKHAIRLTRVVDKPRPIALPFPVDLTYGHNLIILARLDIADIHVHKVPVGERRRGIYRLELARVPANDGACAEGAFGVSADAAVGRRAELKVLFPV